MFPFHNVAPEHREIARRYIGDLDREPDLVIGTDRPYLYRWYVVDRNPDANIYFHIQVASDPDRPLHDHPWDNMSVILANAYDEVCQHHLGDYVRKRFEHEVIIRKAEDAHRLILPVGVPYVMTQFATGPKDRTWGFHTAEGWKPYYACIATSEVDGQQVSKWTADGRDYE